MLQTQIAFDPFEKQLDVPALFVKHCNRSAGTSMWLVKVGIPFVEKGNGPRKSSFG
jgi:hypothetical protein